MQLAEALLAAGAVSGEESRDRQCLEQVVSEMLDEWMSRALKVFRDA